jgi:hypothetical protein
MAQVTIAPKFGSLRKIGFFKAILSIAVSAAAAK